MPRDRRTRVVVKKYYPGGGISISEHFEDPPPISRAQAYAIRMFYKRRRRGAGGK